MKRFGNPIRLLSVFLLTTMLLFTASAQQHSKSSVFIINSKTNASFGLLGNQAILNALSASGEKAVQDISLYYQVAVLAQISNAGNDFDEWTLLVKPEFARGDAMYRSFSLDGVLIPDRCRLRVDNVVYSATSGSGEIAVGNQVLLRLPKSNSSPVFTIDYLSFSNTRRNEVLQLIGLVNQYWASVKLLDSLLGQGERGDAESRAGYAGLFAARDKLRKAGLNAGNVLQQTGIFAPADPAGLGQRLAATGRLMTRYQTLLLDYRDPRDKNARQIAGAIGRQQLQYIRASLKGDYRDNELMLNMSRLWPDDQLLAQFERMGSDESDVSGAQALFAEEVRLADSLLARSDYAFALNFYEDALGWARLSGLNVPYTQVNDRLETARLGLLRSHLHIAARAVETGNMQLAETYRDRASQYASVRKSEQLAKKLPQQSDDLVKAYIRQAQQLADQKRYQEAIRMYEQAAAAARDFYNIEHELAITEGLFRTHRLVYMDLVKEAEELHNAGRTEDARRRLQQALAYRADHPEYLRTSMEAVQLQQKIGQGGALPPVSSAERRNTAMSVGRSAQASQEVKQEILRRIPDVQLKAWSNDLPEAWRMYDELIRLQKENFLENDAELKRAFAALDERLIERICLNHRLNIQDWTQKARQDLQRGIVEGVEKMLRDAVETANSNRGCNLDASEAQLMLDRLGPVFAYNREYQTVLKAISEQGIKKAASLYMAFDRDVARFEPERYGIKHQSFDDFVRSQNSLPVLLQAADFYLEQMNDEALMGLIRLLPDFQFRRDEVSELLQKSAALFAVADKARGIGRHGMVINDLIKTDSRLAPLQKAYKSALRQLK
ncbi:MAG: tetratricopeptide repeat protein [Bacteroidia bacterium]|jgi:tetratricopeptide (TPR) repeat protein|nr:tetratricopeptide repeat protein [Bacteroidia bacterium]